jgi:hypothetical protein
VNILEDFVLSIASPTSDEAFYIQAGTATYLGQQFILVVSSLGFGVAGRKICRSYFFLNSFQRVFEQFIMGEQLCLFIQFT